MKVIFACIHNAGRSQMAAAFFNRLADPERAQALSAGTEPAERIHDCVLSAMKEVGIDLSAERPQLLTGELAADADLLITMGCGEACPFIIGVKRGDWPVADPKGKTPEEVRVIRDEIQDRVMQLFYELKTNFSTSDSEHTQRV